jgi:hypothetical protein
VPSTTSSVWVWTSASGPVSRPAARSMRDRGPVQPGAAGAWSDRHVSVKIRIATGRPKSRLRWVTRSVVIAFPQRQTESPRIV